MQKIIKQDLTGELLSAQRKAKYTWNKGETAWYFCLAHRDIFKVRFTGERWLVGNKWMYEKVYQYRYLSTSGDQDLQGEGLNHDGISHGKEAEFYSTQKEAVKRGIEYLTSKKDSLIEEIDADINRIQSFKNK